MMPDDDNWMFEDAESPFAPDEDADTETAPPQWVTMRPAFLIRVSVVTTEDAA